MLLKIITFNVAHGRGTDNKVDIERQANLIKEYKPDIIFLQEVDMYTKRAGEMNQIREFGIISKFLISFSANYLMPLTDTKHEQRGILYNRISLGTTKLNLFSVHLSTYEDERILAAKELCRIISKIDPSEIIIVGGDFNVGVTRLGKGKYIFEEKESYEEYEILNRKLDKINNIEDTWFSELGQGCIDTIFYSRNIELIKFETIDAKGTSDHSAIYTEFNI